MFVDGDLTLGEGAGIVLVPPVEASPATVASRLRRSDAALASTWLRRKFERGCVLAVGGSAALLAAEAGILDGRRCTTDPSLVHTLRARYPAAILDLSSPVTRAGKLLCASSALDHVELALALIELASGPRTADAIRSLHPSLPAKPADAYIVEDAGAADCSAAKAEVWIRENLSRRFTIGELARAVGVSQRTLSRRIFAAAGISPRMLVQRIRAERARHLLESTSLTVEQVALEVGHRDATQLRRTFRRLTGRTPSQLRRG